jgi:hypothetical protein
MTLPQGDAWKRPASNPVNQTQLGGSPNEGQPKRKSKKKDNHKRPFTTIIIANWNSNEVFQQTKALSPVHSSFAKIAP